MIAKCEAFMMKHIVGLIVITCVGYALFCLWNIGMLARTYAYVPVLMLLASSFIKWLLSAIGALALGGFALHMISGKFSQYHESNSDT